MLLKISLATLAVMVILYATSLVHSRAVEQILQEPSQLNLVATMASPPAEEKPAKVAFFFQWPIHIEDYVRLTSPKGIRSEKEIGGTGDGFHEHGGTDMVGTWLARIVPPIRSQVWVHFYPPGGIWNGHPVLGGLIVLRYYDHSNRTVWWFRYGHLAETRVHEDDWVDKTMVLGRQGNTGQSVRAHLHVEVYRGGECDRETGEITGGEQLNPLLVFKEPI